MIGDTPGRGRVEIKYAVGEEEAAQVLRIARVFLPPDRLAPATGQRITSLYLDSPLLTFLRWHRTASRDRFKLRIRRYGDDHGVTLYAELKRKTNAVVFKQRAPFPWPALPDIIEGSHHRVRPVLAADDHHLREFIRKRILHGATPQVLVSCVRQSLRGTDAEQENAVTVDRDLRYQAVRQPDVVGCRAQWRPLPIPQRGGRASTLIELKYGSQPPVWMTPIIRRLRPSRISFSKYVAAMDDSGGWPQ